MVVGRRRSYSIEMAAYYVLLLLLLLKKVCFLLGTMMTAVVGLFPQTLH